MNSGKKILVVEDEVVIAMDLTSSLKVFGYTVIGHCTKGEEVINFLSHKRPDLVLMDIKLDGELDGIEVAEIINREYNIPIIFLTSYSNKNLIERAKKSNPFGYIVKPYDDRELFTNIEIAIFKHETELKLKESEKKYRELSESIQQIIIECDLEGKIRYINQPGMQLLGLNLADLQNDCSLLSFMGEQSFNRLIERIQNHHNSTLQNVNREYRLTNRLRKQFFVEEYLSPMYEIDKIVGFRGILIDVSSKRLKEKLNILFNKLTFTYSDPSADPMKLVAFILAEFEQQFNYIEDIYFNEFNEETQTFIRHQKNSVSIRTINTGYSEHVVKTKQALYLRGSELTQFIDTYQIPLIGPKAVCWCGFPVQYKNKVLGVFSLKSFTNENVLTRSEFENLSTFFNDVNTLLEKSSYIKSIQESEKQYKLLVNSINDGILQFDLTGKILFANQQMAAMTDYPLDALTGMNISELLPQNPNTEEFLAKHTGSKGKNRNCSYELKLTTRLGQLRDFYVSCSFTQDKKNAADSSLATFIDVTENKKHLELLHESERVFAEMTKNVPGVIFQYRYKADGTGYFSYLSERISEIFGLDASEYLTHQDFLPHLPVEEQEDFSVSVQQAYLEVTNWKHEGSIICGDGNLKWVEGKATPMKIGGELVFNGILIDITERKLALRAIEDNVKEKDKLLKSIPDSIIVINCKGEVLNSYIKRNEKDILGSSKSMVGKNILNLFDQEIGNTILSKAVHSMEKERIVFHELDFPTKNGKSWFELRAVPFGKTSSVVILRNATDIKNNILELQKFFNITEQSNELIMITDKQGNIEYVNPVFTQVTGYELSDIKGKSPSFFKSFKHSSSFYDKLWDTVLSGQTFKAEFNNTKANGELYIEEKTISPLMNQQGEITHFISTGRDVTEERKRERKILTYQRFEKTLEKKEQKYRTLSLIQGQENERKRIAREIHDSLGQMLTVAKANLESLDLKKITGNENIEKVEVVNQIVTEIIQESRRISHNLSPVGLYEFGLHAILVQFVNRINSNMPAVRIELDSNIEGLRFKNEIEINLYRIIQEIVQNALKHSKSDKISIKLYLKNGKLDLSVSDNGVGLDMKHIKNEGTHVFGIKNIEERVKIIDGVLEFISKKDKGLTVNLSLKSKSLTI